MIQRINRWQQTTLLEIVGINPQVERTHQEAATWEEWAAERMAGKQSNGNRKSQKTNPQDP